MKKMAKIFIGAGILAMAAACAPMTPPPPAPGAAGSQVMTQREKDINECKYEAEKYCGGDVFRYADILRACLAAKGWK